MPSLALLAHTYPLSFCGRGFGDGCVCHPGNVQSCVHVPGAGQWSRWSICDAVYIYWSVGIPVPICIDAWQLAGSFAAGILLVVGSIEYVLRSRAGLVDAGRFQLFPALVQQNIGARLFAK